MLSAFFTLTAGIFVTSRIEKRVYHKLTVAETIPEQ